jgi:hypothetical protein
MNKEMIVSSNDHETMVDSRGRPVVELFIERERNRGVVGTSARAEPQVLPGCGRPSRSRPERDGSLRHRRRQHDRPVRRSASDGEAPVARRRAAVGRSPGAPRPPSSPASCRTTTTIGGHDAGLIGEPDDEGEQAREPEPAPRPVRAAVPVCRRGGDAGPARPRRPPTADRELTIDFAAQGRGRCRQVVEAAHQGRGSPAPRSRAVPGHADRRPRRRVPQIESRAAGPAARHRPQSGTAQLHRRGIIRTAASGRRADILGDLNDSTRSGRRSATSWTRPRRRSPSTASRAWSPSCSATSSPRNTRPSASTAWPSTARCSSWSSA